ncbi:MAG TPA: hypothetical protein PLV45_05940, partial [bacterium]|nr:hypothetical protein [bacterium]
MNRFQRIVICMLFVFPVFSSAADTGDAIRWSWHDLSLGILDLDIHTIDVEGSGQQILAVSNRAIYRSEDAGQSWRYVYRLTTDTRIVEAEIAEPAAGEDDTEFDRSNYDPDDLYRE